MNSQKFIKYISLLLLLLLATFDGLAQDQMLRGKITDYEGNPVQDALISMSNNPAEVVKSDLEGKFIIKGQIGQKMKVTVPDFFQKTIEVERDTVTISLSSEDEVIPMGFGITRSREELTNSFSIVKSDELSQSSAVLSANALYGKLAGLTVMHNGGIPGSDDPTLQLRAPGTTRTNDMLILVDGFERPISFFALSEIESVVLLKDAASLALYGQRGANGVLLVTTKMYNKNKIQRPKINIGYENTITKAFRTPEFYDGYRYATAMNEALTNDGLPAIYSENDLNDFKSGVSPYFFPNVDWFKEALRDFGRSNNFNISFGGATKSLRYFTLLDYQNDDGLLKPVDLNNGYSTQFNFNRINLRTNLNINVTATTKLFIRVGASLIDNNQPLESSTNIISAIYSIPSSAFPVTTFNNVWGGTSSYDNNPVAMIAAKGYSVTRTRGVMADIRFVQKLDAILKGLTFEAAYSNDNVIAIRDSKSQSYPYQQISLVKDPSTQAVIDTIVTNYGQKTNLVFGTNVNGNRNGTTLLGKLNYRKDWGNNSISSVLLYQQEQLILINRYNTYLRQQISGNIHFSNKDKYFADFSMSYAGNNLIPEKYRFGWFPALSAAWNLSREGWFGKSTLINDLKLRASWGVTGNGQVPQNMEILINSSAAGYRFTSNNNSAGGWSEGSLSPGNLSFEKSYKTNLGLDVRMLNKINLSVDAFQEERKDILITSIGTVSYVIGNSLAYQMGGAVSSRGIDATLDFHERKGGLGYFFIGRFSFARSKVTEMFEEYRPYDYLKRTGKSVGQTFGLESIGLFKDMIEISESPLQRFGEVGPGDIKYKDQNGDNVIDEFDEIALGYSSLYPEINYSGTVGLEFKGLGFDALIQGIGNYSVYANTRHLFWPMYENANISTFSDDRWTTETAETATLPRISTERSLNNYRSNSTWIMDGSYLKLRSLELYYNLPGKLVEKLKIANTRIYVKGMNLFSFDHIKVVDPEEIGIEYPTLTSFHIGIKLEL